MNNDDLIKFLDENPNIKNELINKAKNYNLSNQVQNVINDIDTSDNEYLKNVVNTPNQNTTQNTTNNNLSQHIAKEQHTKYNNDLANTNLAQNNDVNNNLNAQSQEQTPTQKVAQALNEKPKLPNNINEVKTLDETIRDEKNNTIDYI